MATSRDREERGRLQEPSNRRNRLPDLISVTMSDGSRVEINLTGANREEREDVARFLDVHTTVAMAPAARRESRDRSPRLAFSSGPTLRVTSPDVQDRFRQLPPPPSQGMASQLLMKECRLSELEPRTSRNCDPNDVEAHPCRRHQRWPQARGHCLCPLLQRNLRLNSIARRRRDSRPREKKCFCNYDTYLSVHIMKWFDAMCEEPFDAVAKVVVCVSENDETNGLTQCVKNHFWSGKKHFFVRNECGAASVLFVGKQLASYQLSHYRCTVTNENVLPLHLRLRAVLSFRLTFPVVCCFHCRNEKRGT